MEYEARQDRQEAERLWMEQRKENILAGARPQEPEKLPIPEPPSDPLEIDRRLLTHCPPQPWCLACRLGKGNDARHPAMNSKLEAAKLQLD